MLHADMPMGHTLGWEAFLCLNYSVNVSGLNKHSFEMVRGANAPPPKKTLKDLQNDRTTAQEHFENIPLLRSKI